MKAAVIHPTNSELDNTRNVTNSLQRHFSRIPRDIHILTDDDTPLDGTADDSRAQDRRFDKLPPPEPGVLKSAWARAFIRRTQFVPDDPGAGALSAMHSAFGYRWGDALSRYSI